MSGLDNAIPLAVLAALFPLGAHLGGLRGAPFRPDRKTQSSKIERVVFDQLPLLLVLNGGLVGAAVFLARSGSTVAGIIVAALAIPSILAQLAALVIAKARDVSTAGRR